MRKPFIPAAVLGAVIALVMASPALAQKISSQGRDSWKLAVAQVGAKNYTKACGILSSMRIRDLRALEKSTEWRPSALARKISENSTVPCRLPDLNAALPDEQEFNGEAEVN